MSIFVDAVFLGGDSGFAKNSSKLQVLLSNLEAVKNNTRYVEEDLNRSGHEICRFLTS